MEKRKLESNVWKLYCARAMRSFVMTMPIIVLFFKDNGLSMQEIFLLQALFSVAVIILEVPTGYFADVFGRKNSIVIGGVVSTLGFVIYSLSSSFWWFLLAEVALGIGISFISGSDSAMLFDTLLELKRVEEYKKIEGRGMSLGLASESVAAIAGGLLAIVSLRLPLIGDALTMSLIIPVSLTLVEPKRKTIKPGESSLRNIFRIMRFSLHEDKKLKWLIIHSSFVAASTLTMVWFIQPYLLEAGVPLGLFGFLWAILIFVAAFFSWHAHAVEDFLGKGKLLIFIAAAPVVGYFLLSCLHFVWSGVFILLFYVTRGINGPITSFYINGQIDSDARATILSIKNLLMRVIFSIVGPVVGGLADTHSLKFALAVSGITFLFLGAISLFMLRGHKAL